MNTKQTNHHGFTRPMSFDRWNLDPNLIRTGLPDNEASILTYADEDNLHELQRNALVPLSFVANECLAYAARNGSLMRLNHLITLGVDIHYRHEIALRSAAMKNHATVVQYLLCHGADLNEALRASAFAGNLPAVKCLCDNGVDATNLTLLQNVLQLACENGHMAVVNYLYRRYPKETEPIHIKLRIHI